jgi:hypothetical protein
MKKFIYISGIVIINIFVIGALFKILHWPGASIFITLGLGLFSVGFLPLAFIKSYAGNGKKNKSLYIAGFICAFICFIGALFKIQHWQGAGWFLIVGIPLPFIYFLPVYIYHHNKSQERSSVNFLGVMFLMVYIALFSSILALNVSRDTLNAFTRGDEDNAGTTELLALKNKQSYEMLEKKGITDLKEKTDQLKTRSEAICSMINNIKVALIKSVDGENTSVLDNEGKVNASAIMGKDESAHTTRIMRGDDGASGKAVELKEQVRLYREFIHSFVASKNTSQMNIDELLGTSDTTDPIYDNGKTIKWEDTFFPNGAYIITVIGNLDCIETNVRLAEAEALYCISGN